MLHRIRSPIGLVLALVLAVVLGSGFAITFTGDGPSEIASPVSSTLTAATDQDVGAPVVVLAPVLTWTSFQEATGATPYLEAKLARAGPLYVMGAVLAAVLVSTAWYYGPHWRYRPRRVAGRRRYFGATAACRSRQTVRQATIALGRVLLNLMHRLRVTVLGQPAAHLQLATPFGAYPSSGTAGSGQHGPNSTETLTANSRGRPVFLGILAAKLETTSIRARPGSPAGGRDDVTTHRHRT